MTDVDPRQATELGLRDACASAGIPQQLPDVHNATVTAYKPRRQDRVSLDLPRRAAACDNDAATMPAKKPLSDAEMLEKRQALAERVRHARKLRKMSRTELATIAGCTSDHIGKLERAGAWPGAELVIGMAHALDTSPGWMLTGDGPGPDEEHTQVRGATKRYSRIEGSGKLPDAVVAYLALGASEHGPDVADALRRFDWDALQMQRITLNEVRLLARELAAGRGKRDTP